MKKAHTIINTVDPHKPFDKPLPKLTRKQQAFVDYLVNNPKDSGTKAALNAYNVNTEASAAQVAYENLRKPEIVSQLGNSLELVETALIDTVRDWKRSEKPRQREIAMDSAKFIHDKVVGRAKQQIEMTASHVSIVMDLTGGQYGKGAQSSPLFDARTSPTIVLN